MQATNGKLDYSCVKNNVIMPVTHSWWIIVAVYWRTGDSPSYRQLDVLEVLLTCCEVLMRELATWVVVSMATETSLTDDIHGKSIVGVSLS